MQTHSLDTLVAATHDELYEVITDGGGGGGGVPAMIASRIGSGSSGSTTSSSASGWAPFRDINGLLADRDGRIYIMDGASLLDMTQPGSIVRSLGQINNGRYGVAAITPSGWLAMGKFHQRALILYGPVFGASTQQQTSDPSLASLLGAVLAPSSDTACGGVAAGCNERLVTSTPPPTSALVRSLPAPTGGEASSNGGTAAAASGAGASGESLALMARTVITVRVGDRAFVAHRALLAERCGYFRQLLASEGFAESVPATQLKATAVLADRLLVPEVCDLLKPRLLAAACTPVNVISYLQWAEAHNFTSLVAALKTYFITHCKAAAAAAPEQLVEQASQNPDLAAELIRDLARS
ncbi:hypothetical protein GPECTOR_20g524 [Gonium pectorale]|uniref:BTB domain-containing protein n=1 Tax=Gonium pectorale TaxID=33097 RepID=A0A150GIM8_GONPE|nr:hypothetical protein GPECTOR_20g524 [Gonium pectorale]|eukprot:KXZ49667.1 hypothetical protein GPECTOR_20g524 [Gonium pectorale]